MTIDPTLQNEFYVRLGGKGNIDKPLIIGHNYQVKASGTITSFTESDLNDGRHVVYYKFQPILIELLTDLGESIKAKDTRSMSSLLRAKLWKEWQKAQTSLTFDSWYEVLMQRMIQSSEDLASMYGPDDRN